MIKIVIIGLVIATITGLGSFALHQSVKLGKYEQFNKQCRAVIQDKLNDQKISSRPIADIDDLIERMRKR